LEPGGKLFASTTGPSHMKEMYDLVAGFAGDRKISAPELAFDLTNGAAMLRPFFSTVERRRYPDGLVVDDPVPLTEYILSCSFSAPLRGRREELLTYLEHLIDRNGPLHIKKESGVFVARRG
jgi:hypothetical protein